MSIRQPVVLHQTPNRKSSVGKGQTAKQQHLRPSVISSPIVETDFAQLEDGSLVEMIEDPENPSGAAFVLYKDGEAQIVDRIQSAARTLKPRAAQLEVHHSVT